MKLVIDKIDDRRKQIYSGKKWQDGEYLSRAIVELSALNSFLGEHIAQAKLDANNGEAHYKVTREGRKMQLINEEKMSGTAADAQKVVDTEGEWNSHNSAIYTVDLLSLKRADTNNLIDACRSRLSFMKQERTNS